MRPAVVVCGSFHRDPAGLRRLFRELEQTGCRIISPIAISFQDSSLPIVRADHEDEFSIGELERWHLRALKSADFIVLHAPDGYVGISGAYELGFAQALGKPAFSLTEPADEMLATRVSIIGSVFEALDQLSLAG